MPRKPEPARDPARLWEMLTAAREVASFVQGRTFDDYESNILLRRGVERSVEIIGEAARRVSQEYRDAHAEIPWHKIIVQRHRLAHEYDAVDDDLIWAVATKHVPVLIRELVRLGVDQP